MKDPQYEHLRETSWRRKLTPSEQEQLSAWLAAHPEAQAEWEAESGLNDALAALPNVPVASNFTARVVAAARQHSDTQKEARPVLTSRRPWWNRWLPKLALSAVVLAAGLVSYNYIQQENRAELARSLSVVSQVPSVPNPDILKDFDTIAVLSSAPAADVELLRVMQ